MDDKAKLLEKLKRLLSMTTQAGASEQEALIAAEKAAALMAEHNLSYRTVADIEAESFGDDKRNWCRARSRSTGNSRRMPTLPPVNLLLPSISELCGVEHWFSRWYGDLCYFGASHDTAIAHYLTEIINRAMLREWKAYREKRAGASRASFMQGMALRLARRLFEMAERTKADEVATGTGLVVVKNALVKERFLKANPNLKESAKRRPAGDILAVRCGYEAGGRIELHKGLNEASGTRLLSSFPPSSEGGNG